jgi:uncharacterized phiE125 gp8 family phage protein
MSLTLVPAAPPAPVLEELLLPDAKANLRVDTTYEDAFIVQCLAAARTHVEGRDGVANRCLLTQTWDWTLPWWPVYGPVHPPLAPLQSVTSITVRSPAGVEAVWPSTSYEVDLGDGLGSIQPLMGSTWPPAAPTLAPIKVRFVAGYGARLDLIPASLRQALLGLAGEFYTHRDLAAPAPTWIDRLLWPYRLVGV